MKEQFFNFFEPRRNSENIFWVKKKGYFCSEEMVIFRKNQVEKDKKKTKQKREEQLKGFHWKRRKKENEKGDSGETQRFKKKRKENVC